MRWADDKTKLFYWRVSQTRGIDLADLDQNGGDGGWILLLPCVDNTVAIPIL